MPAAFAFYYLGLLSISLLEDNPASDFDSLGKAALGGFAVAVAVAVAVTLLSNYVCATETHPRRLISITSQREEDVTAKPTGD